MILFTKHIDIEGPDTLDVFFKKQGFDTQTVELHRGEQLPAGPEDIEAMVSLGGPMSVYDENEYPFLKDEDAFIKRILADGIPFMGICLGSQLLAKACGARVNKSPQKEIGFLPVQVRKDRLFDGVDGTIEAFHWHEDMSELPVNATLLASSEGCPHQAFRMGDRAYGLQFHIEVTRPTIEKWIDKYFSKDNPEHMRKKEKMLADYTSRQSEFHGIGDIICRNFLNIMRGA